ncbi:MAG: segregation and condensation protein A [Armatimonadota bacterium]
MTRCLVRLEGFEGPVRALVHEVRQEHLCIHDIPIRCIVQQIAEFLALCGEPDLDEAGECILASAELIELKSRSLLPAPPQPEKEEDDPVATEERLRRRLEEYRQYREIAELLKAMEERRSRYYPRPVPAVVPLQVRPLVALPEPAVVSLLSALKRLLESVGDSSPVGIVPRERITLRTKMQEVWSAVSAAGDQGVRFTSLFSYDGSRVEIIATFLAILELLRLRRIRVHQDRPLGEIFVFASGHSDAYGAEQSRTD